MGSFSSAREWFAVDRKSFEVVLEGSKEDSIRVSEFSKGFRRSICLSPAEANWFASSCTSLFSETQAEDSFLKLRSSDRCFYLGKQQNALGRFLRLTEVNPRGSLSILFPAGADNSGWSKLLKCSRSILELIPSSSTTETSSIPVPKEPPPSLSTAETSSLPVSKEPPPSLSRSHGVALTSPPQSSFHCASANLVCPCCETRLVVSLKAADDPEKLVAAAVISPGVACAFNAVESRSNALARATTARERGLDHPRIATPNGSVSNHAHVNPWLVGRPRFISSRPSGPSLAPPPPARSGPSFQPLEPVQSLKTSNRFGPLSVGPRDFPLDGEAPPKMPQSLGGPLKTPLTSSAPARKSRGRKRRSRRRRKKKQTSRQPLKQHQQKSQTTHLAVVQKQIEDLRVLLVQLGSSNRTRAKKASSRRLNRRWIPSGRVIHLPDPPLPAPAVNQLPSASDSLPGAEAVPESDSDATDWEELADFHDDLLIPGLQVQFAQKLLEQEEQEEALLQAAHEEIKEGFRFASFGLGAAVHPQENHEANQENLPNSIEPSVVDLPQENPADTPETLAESQEISHPVVSQEFPVDSQEVPVPSQENPDCQELPFGSQEAPSVCQENPVEEQPLENSQELLFGTVQRPKDTVQGGDLALEGAPSVCPSTLQQKLVPLGHSVVSPDRPAVSNPATESAPLFLEPVGNAQDLSIQEAFLQATGLSLVGSEGKELKLALTSKVCSSMNSSKRTKRELKKLQFNVNYERNAQRKKGIS